MTVHLFGATSSPGWANFALKTTADQYKETCSNTAADLICFRKAQYQDVTSLKTDEVKNVELHHFSDACQNGYGKFSYIRLVDEKNRVHCSLVMGKSGVMPLKTVTIPRLELTAAVVSSKISCMLWKDWIMHR